MPYCRYNKRHVGVYLRNYRRKNKLSPLQLSYMLEVSESHVKNIESGNQFAGLDLTIRIALLTNCSIDLLLLGDEGVDSNCTR